MKKYKYVFLLCSSTNIDRIAGASIAAAQAGKVFVIDEFQKKMLDVVEKNSNNCKLYKFQKIFLYKKRYSDESLKKVDDYMRKKGFCMLVRSGGSYEGKNNFIKVINKYKDAAIVYSMWSDYKKKDKDVISFIEQCSGKKVIDVHTSGHASTSAIKEVCELVKKKNTVIMPVHTENSQLINSLINGVKIVIPEMSVDYDI